MKELNYSQQGVTYCLKLPCFWKAADVTSILQKSTRENPGNGRNVSLTCTGQITRNHDKEQN